MKLEQLPKRIVLLMLAPLVVAIGIAAFLADRHAARERSEDLRTRAEAASETLLRVLDHAAAMASVLTLVEPDRAGCSDALATVHEARDGAYSFIGIAGSEGRLLCGVPAEAVDQDVLDFSWLSEVTGTGGAAYGGYQVIPVTGDKVIVVARAVVPPQGDRGSLAVVAIRLDWLAARLMAGAGDGASGLVVIDPSGTIVATTIDGLPIGARVDPPGSNGSIRADIAGTVREIFVRDIALGSNTFHVFAVTPESGPLPGMQRIVPAFALVTLLPGLAASLIAFRWLHRGVVGPIRRMLDAAPRVARVETNEIAQERGVPEELHRLGTAFDAMASMLKAQAATLDRAWRIAGLGTWTILPNLEAVRASSHIRSILGVVGEDDVVQLDAIRERIVPEDRAAFDAALERAVKDRGMADVEFRAVDVVGEARLFRARTGAGDAVPDGAEGAIAGIIEDVTDLRQRERALATSLRLERLAGEAARIGGWRFDLATREFTGTPEAANLVGHERGRELPVEDVTSRFAEADRVRMERSFWTCVGSGIRFDEIAKFQTFDGEETWMRLIGKAERNKSGRIIAVYGAVQDVGELVDAQLASERVQALLQSILDSLGDGFAIQDRDGTIRYMNRRAHTVLGVPDRNLVGSNIWQELPRAVGSWFEQIVADAMETGVSQTREGYVLTSERWLQIAVHPTAAGVATYFCDVTEERAVRERLRLLDAAVARLNDVVLITDAADLDLGRPRIVFVNEAFLNMTGYSRDEALGSTPRMLQGPETERERLDEIRNAMKQRQHLRTELTNYRKDGSSFTVEIDINPVFDAAGECTHFVSVQRDTTERRQNEEHLRAREELFRLVSMASDDIIWDWDMRTGIIWYSDNSEKVLGHPPNGEQRIESTLERIHPDDRLKYTESLDAALAGAERSWRCEYRIEGDDGTYWNMTDKGFIQRDDEGAPRRMVGAMADVTEIRSLDAQLHQSRKLETVGELTGGIAHDFNNLLTIILGNCDILLDETADDSPLRPLIQSIAEAAERGGRVSTDLLAYSRRQPLEPRPTDINELIRRSSSLFSRAVEASIDIRYDLTDSPTVALVDPGKLQAALLNLVLNAKGAIPQEGTITVKTRPANIMVNDLNYDCKPGEYVEIDVVDDGIGMSPEVMERAFEPFFTTKEQGVGTGMGLSSVYGLVKQSGGHANLASEPGKGTTVTLCLPIAQEPEEDKPAETTDAPHAGGGHRILVVEDDAEVRTFVRAALSKMGYRVVETENGANAVKLLEEDDGFDLVFTDIVMPGGVNGVQLAQKARELQPALRILFTSGYAREALPKEGDLPSDIPMLVKPFRTTELAEKVQEVLSNGVVPGN